MRTFTRSDTSVLARWWWSVDKVMLIAIVAVIAVGVLLNFSISPVKAQGYMMIRKHLVLLSLAFAALIFMSFQTPKTVRRLALLLFLVSLIFTFGTLIAGLEEKGARRWIRVMGLSFQPSEFLKPSFAVIAAWLLAKGRKLGNYKYALVSAGILLVIIALLMLQPDMGMTFTVCVIWASQFWLSGVNILLIFGIMLALALLGVSAYWFMPHFQVRINAFLHPESSDNYQVKTAFEAFNHGGWFGTGPGEGQLKSSVPDAHTDFIMAVAGEEFGFVLCGLIVFLFALILFRGIVMTMRENNFFTMLASAGILVQFGFQALVNMSSTLHLIPTKGMTLPFISYGGSSLVSMGFAMGMVLAFTRRRVGSEENE